MKHFLKISLFIICLLVYVVNKTHAQSTILVENINIYDFCGNLFTGNSLVIDEDDIINIGYIEKGLLNLFFPELITDEHLYEIERSEYFAATITPDLKVFSPFFNIRLLAENVYDDTGRLLGHGWNAIFYYANQDGDCKYYDTILSLKKGWNIIIEISNRNPIVLNDITIAYERGYKWYIEYIVE